VIVAGGTVDEAAQRIGRPVATVRRWLSQGRKNPSGPWGELARAVEAARTARMQIPEATGERLAEVEAFIATLDMTLELAPRVGLLRSIARKLDWAEQTNTGIAAMAAERLAARYADLMDQVQPLGVSSDMDKLAEALTAGIGSNEEYFRGVLSVIATGGMTSPKATPLTADELRTIAREAMDQGGYRKAALLDAP
jgi:hypothetical protein